MIAPHFLIVLVNKSIIKKFKLMSKQVKTEKVFDLVPNTAYTFLDVFELVLKLLIGDFEILTIQEVLYRRHMARAYYNLISKYI